MQKPVPEIYALRILLLEARSGPQAEIRGEWVPCRPQGRRGLFLRLRLKAAWLAFTGRCDLVRWAGGQ